jgi:hypothetical protein
MGPVVGAFPAGEFMTHVSRRVGSLFAGLLLLLAIPSSATAQYSADDERKAIDAVTSFLNEMGEGKAAETWKDGWKRGIYSFARLDGDTEAQVSAGNERIQFSDNMLAQLATRNPPEMRIVADWAATFQHELIHTKQGKVGWAAAEWSHVAGKGHFHEAAAWGEGFGAYWRWLTLANTNHARARTEDERQKFARRIVDLAASFRVYFDNYQKMKFGPLPKGTRFAPLGGTDSTPLTLEEAVKEADRINRSVGSSLRLAVRLSKTTYRLKAGETITLIARPTNSWNKPSFTWKSGSKLLAETSQTLTRIATVDEAISVTVQDNRNQKASASCDVIVEKQATAARAPQPTAPQSPAAKAPAQKPSTGEYAWVQMGKRTNDWQARLGRQNASMKGWKHGVSASEGSVTIKNTYVGDRADNWAKKGMSESGTATWTPPSKSTIRSGDVVSVDLTTLNAPRDHSNFFGIISTKVETWRLGKDGARTGGSSYFADEKGREVLGYGYPRGNQTKALVAMTVSHKFGAGAAAGDRMAICVTALGASELVQTEYIYEWRRL